MSDHPPAQAPMADAPMADTPMADDTVGLLDALELESAHIVGMSMGGMIVQTVAIRHPRRVRSLTSVMSSTGDAELSNPTPEAIPTRTISLGEAGGVPPASSRAASGAFPRLRLGWRRSPWPFIPA